MLQSLSRKMGVVVTVVIQMHASCHAHLQPNLSSFFQVQRRLDGQRTVLISVGVCLTNISLPDLSPVQKYINC